MKDRRFRVALAIAAIEKVHEEPHGSAKDEILAVARALGHRRDVAESVSDALFMYGQHGPEPTDYAEKAVRLLDHELLHRTYSA